MLQHATLGSVAATAYIKIGLNLCALEERFVTQHLHRQPRYDNEQANLWSRQMSCSGQEIVLYTGETSGVEKQAVCSSAF